MNCSLKIAKRGPGHSMAGKEVPRSEPLHLRMVPQMELPEAVWISGIITPSTSYSRAGRVV